MSEIDRVFERLGFKYNPNTNMWVKVIIPGGDPRDRRYVLQAKMDEKGNINFETTPPMREEIIEYLGEVLLFKKHMAGEINIFEIDLDEPVPVEVDGNRYFAELSLTPDAAKEMHKNEEKPEKEGKKETKTLNWNEDKDMIKTILKELGFMETKRETLFVKNIEGDDAIFCDFSKTPKGHFYRKSGKDAHETAEYKAFRAMQEGRGKIEGDKVIVNEGEQQIILTMPSPVVRPKAKPEEFAIEIEGKKIKLNPDLLVNIKNNWFATIDAVVDAMHRAGILKGWTVEIIKYPEKILAEKKEGEEEPEDINSDKYLAVAKATVLLSDGRKFENVGDAHPLSVAGHLRPHVLRMAETRAIARALRFAGNIHGAMAEEIKEYVKLEGKEERYED